MTELAREFWLFLRIRKKWWLAPILLVLGLVGLRILGTQGHRPVHLHPILVTGDCRPTCGI